MSSAAFHTHHLERSPLTSSWFMCSFLYHSLTAPTSLLYAASFTARIWELSCNGRILEDKLNPNLLPFANYILWTWLKKFTSIFSSILRKHISYQNSLNRKLKNQMAHKECMLLYMFSFTFWEFPLRRFLVWNKWGVSLSDWPWGRDAVLHPPHHHLLAVHH